MRPIIELVDRIRQWLAASRRRQVAAIAAALAAGGAVAAVVAVLATSGDGDGVTLVVQTATPTPQATRARSTATPTPAPTPTAAPPSLPAIIDAQELFVVDAAGGEPVLLHQTTSYYQGIEWSPDEERVAFAVGGAQGRIYVVDPTSPSRDPAVDVEGYVETMMWSPTGKFIAYQSSATDGGSVSRVISVFEPVSRSVRRLLSGGEELALADWFPNSDEVLVTNGPQLAKVDAASGAYAELGQAFEGRALRGASASPDGRSVALAVSSGSGACRTVDATAIFMVSSADGTAREVVSSACGAGRIAWSPDGKAIAWADYESGPYILDIGEGQPRLLANTRQAGDIDWLADGSGVTVVRCYEGCYEQLLASLDGATHVLASTQDRRFAGFGGFAPDSRRYLYSDDVVRVSTLDGEEEAITEADPESAYSALTWSPAGDRVAYVRGPNENTRTYSVKLKTAQVTRHAPPAIFGAVQSPDGALLAFLKPKEEGDGSRKLWVANADGSDERLVADTAIGSFAWSPDGRLLAYSSIDTDTLHTVAVQTLETHQLNVAAANFKIAGFSPDGSSLAVARSNELILIDLESGNSELLVQGIEVPSFDEAWPAWSPDGAALAYRQRDAAGVAHIYVVDVSTAEARQLTRGPSNDLGPVWSPDGKSIAFWRVLGGNPSVDALYVVRLDGSERELSRFEVSGGSASNVPAWSPDSDRIAVFIASQDAPGIYLIGADGGGLEHVVATGRFDNRGLGWSDDGTELVFTSFYSGI